MVPRIEILVLLVIAIWSGCRFYYFAFYVIEKYIDAEQKFDGLYATFIYLIQRGRLKENIDDKGTSE